MTSNGNSYSFKTSLVRKRRELMNDEMRQLSFTKRQHACLALSFGLSNQSPAADRPYILWS